MSTTTKVAIIPIWQNLSLENLPNEIWKPIKNYNGFYEISNLGRVKTVFRYIKVRNGFLASVPTRIRIQQQKPNGYLKVDLSKHGKVKTFHVHRLVCDAFNENNKNEKEVNHIDENKENNKSDNLHWCNRLFNVNYGNKPHYKNKKISKHDMSGRLIKTYNSITEATHEGYTNSCISVCCSGHRPHHRNFIWKYL